MVIELNGFHFAQHNRATIFNGHGDCAVVRRRDECCVARVGVDDDGVTADVVIGHFEFWICKIVRSTLHFHIRIGRQHHSGITKGIGANGDGVCGSGVCEIVHCHFADAAIVVQANGGVGK